MFFIKEKESPVLSESGSVFLRFPEASDYSEFVGKAKRSTAFHKGLVSPPLDKTSFDEYVAKNESETECCFLLVERNSNEIAGSINVSQIFLKGFRSAHLGYYLFEGYSGRGLMSDGIKGMLTYAFRKLGLHRLEANIQPHKDSSIRLVQRCGFTKEGYSRKYLLIADQWRDHERWAIIKEDLIADDSE